MGSQRAASAQPAQPAALASAFLLYSWFAPFRSADGQLARCSVVLLLTHVNNMDTSPL